MANVIRQSRAMCILEPRGDHGLEGYEKGENHNYKFQYMDADKSGKPYYRIWPDEFSSPEYYETCGPKVFRMYFKEIS